MMQQQAFTFEPKKATPKIYSVTEVVSGAREILERTYSDIWVVGEVSRFTHHSSGHWYFTLKDEKSVLSVAIFRPHTSHIKFKVEDGLELICHGKFSLFQRGGQYQLIGDYIEPKGKGELQLAFEQLKKRLEAEGLFAKERKRPIPFMPKKIGIVTSPTGAAIRDILKVLKRRFPNIEVLLVPVRVQGEGSAGEIVEGIELLNQRGDVDVMIVGRGGGSIEDLWSFNEEIVARAIFNSRIPVISAVGHEIDFTIADFVADFRAPTPSAAAEHAVAVKVDLVDGLRRFKRQLFVNLGKNLDDRATRIRDYKRRLRPPTERFPEYYRYMDNLKERMQYSLQVSVSKKENCFKTLIAELNHLSPLAVMGKGYSVVTKKGLERAIRGSSELKEGDSITVRFGRGAAEGKVTKVLD